MSYGLRSDTHVPRITSEDSRIVLRDWLSVKCALFELGTAL
jgi:hypothetical protein